MKTACRATAAIVVGSLLLASTVQAGGWHGGHYGRYGGYYGHGSNDWAIALGVTGAIIGTAIIADAIARPRTAYVVERPAYYPPPPAYYPPPGAYYPPPAPYPSAAYEEGYRAGMADAHSYPRQWERRDAQYNR